MKIYDISQELLSCEVYPGDTAPEARLVRRIDAGDKCNVTDLTMCAHNGTHIDAPRHFIGDGAGIDGINPEILIGNAHVAAFEGEIKDEDIGGLPDTCVRLLVKGGGWMTPESARAAVERGILLIGTESQSIGPAGKPMETHIILLSRGTVLLEGIRLADVAPGEYLLFAAPLNIRGADGSPVRAVLLEL